MKKTLAVLGISLLVAAGFVAGFGYGRWYGPRTGEASAQKRPGYHCPMHPNIRSDRPGDCGICGMKLVPDDPGAPGGNAHSTEPERDQPAGGSVHVPAEKQSWIGLRLGRAQMHSFARTIRAAGRVAVDETRVVKVLSRNEGWIERVDADFTGQLVHKGTPMAAIYSPELVASQQEYLLAVKAREQLKDSPVPGAHQHNIDLVDAARRRLQNHWGLSVEEIVDLEMNKTPRRTFTVKAPATGFVTRRNAYAGQRVTSETELYSLTGLERVWIVADVPEVDAAAVQPGMAAFVEPASGGGRIAAKVAYIVPQVESQTRTLQVRLEVENTGYRLRPDEFVTVTFHAGGGSRLSVPEEAVLDSGLRQVVWVELGEGHFAPREVQTGERAGGWVEIVSGLKPGERIAVSGAFLLDSESQMRAPVRSGASPASSSPKAPEGHQHD